MIEPTIEIMVTANSRKGGNIPLSLTKTEAYNLLSQLENALLKLSESETKDYTTVWSKPAGKPAKDNFIAIG